MKKTYFLKIAAFCTATLLASAACKENTPAPEPGGEPDPEPIVTLTTPTVTLASEKTSNPIVLEFAWSAVENAGSYEYKLEEGSALIVEGTVEALRLEIAATGDVAVVSGTEYVFSVRAVPADEQKYEPSEWGKAAVATDTAPFKLSVSNVTYRTADMRCVPSDGEMKYGLSQITLARYNEYPDDETFYQEYEKQYYKVVAMQVGAPWYMLMESMMTTGEYGYHTGALVPETDYLLYAYGVKAMVEEFDIALVTPIMKLPFRTPAWKATVDCRFDITVGEVTPSKIVIDVVPSKDDVTYYFGVIPCSVAEQTYHNDMAALTRDILYQQEAVNKVDWTNTDLLHSGALTFSLGEEQIAGLLSGQKYFALAFGVDTRGLQTTELSQTTFDAPQTASASARPNGSAQGAPVIADRAIVAIPVADGIFDAAPQAR